MLELVMATLVESQAKIEEKIRTLNAIPGNTGQWLALDGFHGLTQFQFLPNNGANFIPNSGYPIKVFVNSETGEVRMFPAVFFTDSHE